MHFSKSFRGPSREIPDFMRKFAGEITESGLLVRKGLEVKADAATISENTISGAAAALGNLDRGRDVLFPGCGCFDKAIPGFLKNGSVLQGHEWSDPPLAMPLECEERGRQLWSKAEFHSTPAAQEARTIAKERQAKGLSNSLSIGFRLKGSGYGYFENGQELLDFAADTLKLDMSLFDVDIIAAYGNWCRGIWNVDELYEWSIVAVPMNPEALADADGIKSAEGFASLRSLLLATNLDEKSADALLSGGLDGLLAAPGGPDLSAWLKSLPDVVKSPKFNAPVHDNGDSLAGQRAEAEFALLKSKTDRLLADWE